MGVEALGIEHVPRPFPRRLPHFSCIIGIGKQSCDSLCETITIAKRNKLSGNAGFDKIALPIQVIGGDRCPSQGRLGQRPPS